MLNKNISATPIKMALNILNALATESKISATFESPSGSTKPLKRRDERLKSAIEIIGPMTVATKSKMPPNPTEFLIRMPDTLTISNPSLTNPPRYGT